MRRMVAAQLGEAIRVPFMACALISGMMRGAEARKAELESMQKHFAFGIHSFERADPAQKKARSIPSRLSNISTGIEETAFPTDLGEAKRRNFSMGNFRSRRSRTISAPTAPVAPTTATVFFFCPMA